MPLVLQAQSGARSKGQNPPATNKSSGTRAAPPNSNNADAAPVTPAKKAIADELSDEKLAEFLTQWEARSSKIKSIHGKQQRSEFNHVFEVEKRSEGDFFLQTPDKGRIDMGKVKIAEGAVSPRKNQNGEPYKLETDQSVCWICTGDEILVLQEDEKTYQSEMIPEEQRGTNIVHSPLPFLFGMKAEEAKTRYDMVLRRNSTGSATIEVMPKMEKDRQNYQVAWVTIDKKTYLPLQVRMRDQSNLDIVYTFSNVEVNDSKFLAKMLSRIGIAGKDPFRPKLTGYRKVLPPEEPVIKPAAGTSDDVKLPNRAQKASPPKSTSSKSNGTGTSSSRK